MSRSTRLVTLDDLPVLAELLHENRAFNAPWEPIRDDDYFTVDGQSKVIRSALHQHGHESTLPHVILDGGLATAAVHDIIRVAFEELGLHRIQAGTLLHNVRSQRVLERTGFVRYGVAPAYLKIAGEWQDHALYQVVTTGSAGSPAGV